MAETRNSPRSSGMIPELCGERSFGRAGFRVGGCMNSLISQRVSVINGAGTNVAQKFLHHDLEDQRRRESETGNHSYRESKHDAITDGR